MPRLHFQFPKQACWLLSWFACLFLCAPVIAQSSPGDQPKPKAAKTKAAKTKATSKWSQLFNFEKRTGNSISRLGLIEDKQVSESSGLATAAATGCFWTINDSGNPAELFLFLFGDAGQKLAKVKLENAVNKDWESLASFTLAGKRWGVVADVGDNQRKLDVHQLYFFRDPTDTIAQLKVDQKPSFTAKDFEKLKSVSALPFEFSYQNSQPKETPANGSIKKTTLIRQDCEAVAVDPTTLDIWFVEKVHLNRKRKVVPGIFVLPMPKTQLAVHAGDLSAAAEAIQTSATKPVAKRIGSFPIRFVTGMSFSPDGKKLIIRNYLTAHLFVRPDDKTWKETVVKQKPVLVALPLQSQGEAICFTEDSQSVIVTSEGVRQPIWKIDLRSHFDKFKARQ